MSEETKQGGVIHFLETYSIPLLVSVILAVIIANIVGGHAYHEFWDTTFASFSLFGARTIDVTLHWIVNDVLMVFFFGMAAYEIVEAMLPGGALNPPKKAINPILGTFGGVLGPIAVYLILTHLLIPADDVASVAHGFGIPTATDIALAWLAARIVFGEGHPAIDFLLLLAIADDGIGLGIIAIFYGDGDIKMGWLLLTAFAMILALGMRKAKVNRWWMYAFVAGGFSWLGLAAAGIEPALALVFIFPFIPYQYVGQRDGQAGGPAHDYHHYLGKPVNFVILALFGLANAGVEISAIGTITFIVLIALVGGKLLGISLFSIVGHKLGFPYPTGMSERHVITASIVAAMGLTVALFVTGRAFTGDHMEWQAPAKLGALLSAGSVIIAYFVGKALNVKELAPEKEK